MGFSDAFETIGDALERKLGGNDVYVHESTSRSGRMHSATARRGACPDPKHYSPEVDYSVDVRIWRPATAESPHKDIAVVCFGLGSAAVRLGALEQPYYHAPVMLAKGITEQPEVGEALLAVARTLGVDNHGVMHNGYPETVPKVELTAYDLRIGPADILPMDMPAEFELSEMIGRVLNIPALQS